MVAVVAVAFLYPLGKTVDRVAAVLVYIRHLSQEGQVIHRLPLHRKEIMVVMGKAVLLGLAVEVAQALLAALDLVMQEGTEEMVQPRQSLGVLLLTQAVVAGAASPIQLEVLVVVVLGFGLLAQFLGHLVLVAVVVEVETAVIAGQLLQEQAAPVSSS